MLRANLLGASLRSSIQLTLHGILSDAIAAIPLRVRRPGEAIPNPPNEDFGYEHVVAGIKSGSSMAKKAALLGEAASFHRWQSDEKSRSNSGSVSATTDGRSFKDLLNRRVEVKATDKTLYLFAAGCWTLGARYSSGPLGQTIAGMHRRSVSILAGTKLYAREFGVIDELSRYAINISDLAQDNRMDHWITRFKLVTRPVTYEAVLSALDDNEPRELDEDAENRESRVLRVFEDWNKREAKRLANQLSPLAMLCVKQSYLNFYHGYTPTWARPREHAFLLHAKQEAAYDEIHRFGAKLSYAILADYLRVEEHSDFEMRHVKFGIEPDENVDQAGNPL